MAQDITIASASLVSASLVSASAGPAERRFGIWGRHFGRICDTAMRQAVRAISSLLVLQRHWRERDQLAELSDAALKDLGLSRADIAAELRKPAWRRAA